MDTHLKIDDIFEAIVKGNLAKFHAIVTKHKLDAAILLMICNSCHCKLHPQYRPIIKEETGNPLEVAIRLQKYEIVRYMLNNMLIPVTKCLHMMEAVVEFQDTKLLRMLYTQQYTGAWSLPMTKSLYLMILHANWA